MKYVYLALNWTFGVIFLLVGWVESIQRHWESLILIFMSLLLLPPIRNFAHSKINIELPVKIRGITLCVLFFGYTFILSQINHREAQEEAAKAQAQTKIAADLQKQNVDYFNKNSSQILNEVKTAFENGKFKEVVSLSSKYLPTQNKELIELINLDIKAKSELAAIAKSENEAKEKAEKEEKAKSALAAITNSENEAKEKAEKEEKAKSALAAITKSENEAKEKEEQEAKTQEILFQLKSLPASEYMINYQLYQQLVVYNPNVLKYKEKLAFYNAKIKKQNEKEHIEQKQLSDRLVKFGDRPTRSGWDGSYHSVERYLKAIANDPGSIEIDDCTEVYWTKDGWLVGCNYRGRNAFGGMIRKSNWFTIVHDNVIQIHDISAFKQ